MPPQIEITTDARRLLGQAVRSVDGPGRPHRFPPAKKPAAEELQKAGLAFVRFSEATIMPTKLGRLVFGAPGAPDADDPRMVVPPRSPAGIMQTVIYAAAERLGVPVDTSEDGRGDKTGALIIARAIIDALATVGMQVTKTDQSHRIPGPCCMCGARAIPDLTPRTVEVKLECDTCGATTGDLLPIKEAIERWNRGEVDYPEQKD